MWPTTSDYRGFCRTTENRVRDFCDISAPFAAPGRSHRSTMNRTNAVTDGKLARIWHVQKSEITFNINNLRDGGGRGIRTLDTVTRIHAFQACAFSHSATPPVSSRRTPFSVRTCARHALAPLATHPLCCSLGHGGGRVIIQVATCNPCACNAFDPADEGSNSRQKHMTKCVSFFDIPAHICFLFIIFLFLSKLVDCAQKY